MTSQSGSGVSYVELPSGVDLRVPGLVVEFELLPDLTLQPEWGTEVTAILRHTLDRYVASDGLASALRVTPNDIREFVRPPLLREGEKWDQMVASFDLCAQAGRTCCRSRAQFESAISAYLDPFSPSRRKLAVHKRCRVSVEPPLRQIERQTNFGCRSAKGLRQLDDLAVRALLRKTDDVEISGRSVYESEKKQVAATNDEQPVSLSARREDGSG